MYVGVCVLIRLSTNMVFLSVYITTLWRERRKWRGGCIYQLHSTFVFAQFPKQNKSLPPQPLPPHTYTYNLYINTPLKTASARLVATLAPAHSGVSSISTTNVSSFLSLRMRKKNRWSRHLSEMERSAGSRSSSWAKRPSSPACLMRQYSSRQAYTFSRQMSTSCLHCSARISSDLTQAVTVSVAYWAARRATPWTVRKGVLGGARF